MSTGVEKFHFLLWQLRARCPKPYFPSRRPIIIQLLFRFPRTLSTIKTGFWTALERVCKLRNSLTTYSFPRSNRWNFSYHPSCDGPTLIYRQEIVGPSLFGGWVHCCINPFVTVFEGARIVLELFSSGERFESCAADIVGSGCEAASCWMRSKAEKLEMRTGSLLRTFITTSGGWYFDGTFCQRERACVRRICSLPRALSYLWVPSQCICYNGMWNFQMGL